MSPIAGLGLSDAGEHLIKAGEIVVKPVQRGSAELRIA